MSDLDLQRLRRAFEASGHVDDEAALLRALLRARAISQDRVLLAAACGNEAARLALGDGASQFPDLRAWCGISPAALAFTLRELCAELQPAWDAHPLPGPSPLLALKNPNKEAALSELARAIDDPPEDDDPAVEGAWSCAFAAFLALQVERTGRRRTIPAFVLGVGELLDRYDARLCERLARLELSLPEA